jgi:hypothetical protein
MFKKQIKMRSKIFFLAFILNWVLLLSFKNNDNNGSDVFLSMKYKAKVAIYATSAKQKVVKQIGHNFKDEDYLLFTIYDSNDSMYYVDASYAIAGNNIKGWVSKTIKLSVFTKTYGKSFFLYDLNNKKSFKRTINYTANELQVLDWKKSWLKIKVIINKKEIIGWLPPESQCGNPYTTCN